MADDPPPDLFRQPFTRDDLGPIARFFREWDQWRKARGMPPAKETRFFNQVVDRLEADGVVRRKGGPE